MCEKGLGKMEFRKMCNLTIFTDQDVAYEGRPLFKVIVLKAKELGLKGLTVTKGYTGFAMTSRRQDDLTKFFSGVYNVPMVITIVDARENIDKILPFLDEHAEHCFVTLAETDVLMTKYLKAKIANYDK